MYSYPVLLIRSIKYSVNVCLNLRIWVYSVDIQYS